MVTDDFERGSLNPWVVTGGGPGIVAGNALGAVSAQYFSVEWATFFAADQFSEIVVAEGKDPNLMFQLSLRRQSDRIALYGLHYNMERSPAAWEIKFDAPAKRILAALVDLPPAASDIIHFEARGRDLAAYKNGILLLAATDNDPSAILNTGGTGVRARNRSGYTVTLPTPLAARWRGGSL